MTNPQDRALVHKIIVHLIKRMWRTRRWVTRLEKMPNLPKEVLAGARAHFVESWNTLQTAKRVYYGFE